MRHCFYGKETQEGHLKGIPTKLQTYTQGKEATPQDTAVVSPMSGLETEKDLPDPGQGTAVSVWLSEPKPVRLSWQLNVSR